MLTPADFFKSIAGGSVDCRLRTNDGLSYLQRFCLFTHSFVMFGLTRTPWRIFLNCRCSGMTVVGDTVVNVKVSEHH